MVDSLVPPLLWLRLSGPNRCNATGMNFSDDEGFLGAGSSDSEEGNEPPAKRLSPAPAALEPVPEAPEAPENPPEPPALPPVLPVPPALPAPTPVLPRPAPPPPPPAAPAPATEPFLDVLCYNTLDAAQRTLAKGFSVTCLPFDDIDGMLLMLEAIELLEKHVSVDFESKVGKDPQMIFNLKKGMQHKHGWLVYARNRYDKVQANGIRKDAMIGVMVVSAPKDKWDRVRPVCTINVLGVHDAFRERGVSAEMWLELRKAIQNHPKTGAGGFRLKVEGAKCLNQAGARAFYTNRDFLVVEDSENLFATLDFVDGVPESRS